MPASPRNCSHALYISPLRPCKLKDCTRKQQSCTENWGDVWRPICHALFVAKSPHSSWPFLDLLLPSVQIQRAATSQRSLGLSVQFYQFISSYLFNRLMEGNMYRKSWFFDVFSLKFRVSTCFHWLPVSIFSLQRTRERCAQPHS